MPKAKKDDEPPKDKLMTGMCIFGGLLVLASVVPMLPWRYAAANPNLTSRFSGARAYSLFSIGNNMGTPVSWFKMQGEVCKKVQDMSRANPLAALAGTVASSALGTGGAIMGCQNWQACKDHATKRCSAYRSLAICGILSLLLNIIGAIAAFVVPVMKSQEAQVKKKKTKLESAKGTTMMTSIVAFACPFFGTVTWIGLSDVTFKGLKSGAFFPYPYASAGAYVAGAGVFLLGVGMYCGITRIHPLFGPKQEAQEEVEEYDAQDQPVPAEAALLMPGMGMGPPGMGPPGMGPPGMGPPMPPVA